MKMDKMTSVSSSFSGKGLPILLTRAFSENGRTSILAY